MQTVCVDANEPQVNRSFLFVPADSERKLAKARDTAADALIIDLGRNDVGRVAKTGTVEVTDMMRVEKYSHVMHMVSDVEALLMEDKDMFDLFAATFTAGTMTGAPKIEAMKLIADYEGLAGIVI